MHWFEPINKKLWDRSGWKHLLNTARKISSNHSSYQTRGPVWTRQGKERETPDPGPALEGSYTAADQNSAQATPGLGSLEDTGTTLPFPACTAQGHKHCGWVWAHPGAQKRPQEAEL